METKKILTKAIFPMGIVVFLSACHKEHCGTNQTTQPVTQANSDLDNSYQRANLYNDSLAKCHDGTIANHDSVMEHYYDYQYHHYDSLMVQHHNACHGSSNSGSGDMMGSGGMMGNGGMMGGNNGNMSCGCGAEMHSNMDSLHQNHSQYHPI